MNGDHWLLYLTPPQDDVLQPHALASSSSIKPANPSTPLDQLSASLSSSLPRSHAHFPVPKPLLPKIRAPVTRPDQTLEILMSRLSPKACASFYHPSSSSNTPYTTPLYASDPNHQGAHILGSQLSDRLGLSALLPRATVDSFLFSPCGYSSNAIQGDRYATIHVTPEPDYSYASFESNLDFADEDLLSPIADPDRLGLENPKDGEIGTHGKGANGVGVGVGPGPRNLQELVEKVLVVFEPAKLSITLFVGMDEEAEESQRVEEEEEEGRTQQTKDKRRGKAHEGMKELLNPNLLAKYERVDRILYEFEGYSLVYAVFQAKEGAFGPKSVQKAETVANTSIRKGATL